MSWASWPSQARPAGQATKGADAWRARAFRSGRRGGAAFAVSVVALVLLPALAAAAPPVASFTFTPAQPQPGEAVVFTSTSTDPEDGSLAESWDLDGDGTFGDDNNSTARQRFDTAGPHTVSLRVTDQEGLSDIATQEVIVGSDPPPPQVPPAGNQPPLSSFDFAPALPVAGQSVLFSSQARDPDGVITTLDWDLDADGQFDDASGGSVREVFVAKGVYRVALRATDDQGATSVAFQFVTVAAAGPAATVATGQGQSVSAPLTSRPRLMSPFPVVRLRAAILGRLLRVQILSVKAQVGARVRVRCTGPGCARRALVARVTRRAGPLRLRRLERSFGPGAVIEIFVTTPRRIGKYTRFTMRSGRAPLRRDRCLAPGSSRPAICPNG